MTGGSFWCRNPKCHKREGLTPIPPMRGRVGITHPARAVSPCLARCPGTAAEVGAGLLAGDGGMCAMGGLGWLHRVPDVLPGRVKDALHGRAMLVLWPAFFDPATGSHRGTITGPWRDHGGTGAAADGWQDRPGAGGNRGETIGKPGRDQKRSTGKQKVRRKDMLARKNGLHDRRKWGEWGASKDSTSPSCPKGTNGGTVPGSDP